MSTLRLLLIGLGSRVMVIGLSIVNSILLARWLGPGGLGEYVLLLRLVGVLTVLTGFSLMHSANVYSGRHEEWVGHINQILLRFTLLFWVVASIASGAAMLWAGNILLPDFPRKWMWMALIILPMSLYGNFWNGMMIGRGRIWQLNLVQLITSSVSLTLTVVIIIGFSGGVPGAVMIYFVVTAIQFSLMLIMAQRIRLGPKVTDPPSDLPRSMLSFGLRGYPGAISDLLWSQIPVFLLNAFHGTAAVGIFSVAQQLVERSLLLIQAMQDAIFKKVSVLSRQAAIVAMNRYLRLTIWLMTISTLIGVILAPWIIPLLLGEKYLRSAQIFRLLLPGTIINSAGILLVVFFLGQLRRPGLLSILSWGHALLNLVLSLLLIRKMAEVGAALALVTAQILSGVGLFVLYLHSTGTRIRDLLYLDRDDVLLIRRQLGSILVWRRNEG